MEKDILFYSAFLFIFPVLFALKSKQTNCAILFSCLLVSSLCYHGKYFMPYAKYVDISLAHIITITLTVYGTCMILKGHQRYLLPTIIGYLIIFSYKNLISTKLHHAIIMHFFGAIALILFIKALINSTI